MVHPLGSYHGGMPDLTIGNNPMQVVAAAVTPVVLVSATAILISGVNARYISISDKMRSLAHEWRDLSTNTPRKNIIRIELKTFQERIFLVAWAVRVLYASVACFCAMALAISATTWRKVLETTTVPIFIVGVVLLLTSIFLELVELQLSNRTISTEVKDIIAD